MATLGDESYPAIAACARQFGLSMEEATKALLQFGEAMSVWPCADQRPTACDPPIRRRAIALGGLPKEG